MEKTERVCSTRYSDHDDLAIVKLTAPVMDAGPQPLIYAGTKEKGRLLSFAGFGGRGIGSSGDQDAYYGFSNRWELKAAGQGVIVFDTAEGERVVSVDQLGEDGENGES